MSGALLLLCSTSSIAAGLTQDALKNVTAYAPDMEGDDTHPVEFKDGVRNNGAGIDKVLATAVGDLNGDGIDDGAIVYYENWGGSGAFMRLSVFICKDGKPVQIGYRTLGDRSRTNSLKIHRQTIVLDIMTHAPSDPAPAPSLRRVVKFTVKGGKLKGVDYLS